MFLVKKDRISTNIIKKTPYITILPTFIQIESINFTYVEIIFGIEFFLWQLKLKLELLQELKSLN